MEEKIDGANSAISFSENGELLLQSRGHYLTGGYRERHYNLMKQWANVHKDRFYEVLKKVALELGLDVERQCRETDWTNTMEGLYLKIEENGQVVERLKFVRASFAQCVDESGTHWIDRPIVPNQLAVPMEKLFEG